ncbi:hypothetical protein EJB05_29872, partial [Eragrostis curvula]
GLGNGREQASSKTSRKTSSKTDQLSFWLLPPPQANAMDAAALSEVALQAAADGNLRLLKKASKQLDLRGVKNAGGKNLLHVASTKGRLDICRFLIEDTEGPGLDVNSRSATNGHTPVLVAASEGHLPVLRYLLTRGGDPAMPGVGGLTPLHVAALNGHCDAVKLLLSKGAPVDPLANNITPLHFALAGDHHQAVAILLDHGANAGADVNFTTPYGQTALNEMVDACLPDIAELKEARDDPNYPDKVALDDNLANIVKFLLEAGADANIPNEDAVSVELEERLRNSKSKGKEAFTKEDYLAAVYFYGKAIAIDPLDATLFSNRSVSYLRMGKGQDALVDAARCRMMRPRWAKAWYRQGAALSLLKGGHASYGKI